MDISNNLFRLPPELRNTIYEAVLTTPVYSKNMSAYLTKYNFKKRVALLQVCRQIRQEARSVFYSGNTFLITITERQPITFPNWLIHIEQDLTALIPRVIVGIDFSDWVGIKHDLNGKLKDVSPPSEIACSPKKKQKCLYTLPDDVSLRFAQTLLASGLRSERVTFFGSPRNEVGRYFRDSLKMLGVGRQKLQGIEATVVGRLVVDGSL